MLLALVAGLVVGGPARDTEVSLTRLWREPGWLALLHYRESHGSFRSDVEGDGFFLSSTGATDPRSEFIASIAALNGMPNAFRCEFPARFVWICQHTELDACEARTLCDEVRVFVENHHTGSVAIAFASFYAGHPGSLYGHTFLWLIPPNADTRRESSGVAVSFDTDLTGQSPVTYVPLALAAALSGRYSAEPFDERERRHRYEERRGIWFYPIRLNSAQRDLLVLHLWEVLGREVTYGFTRKNCGLRLLELVEAVAPESAVAADWGAIVAPIETVKRLNSEGLLGEPWARPALWETYQVAVGLLSETEAVDLAGVLDGETAPSEVSNEVLELALVDLELKSPFTTFARQHEANRVGAKNSRPPSLRRSLLLERMRRVSGSTVDELAQIRVMRDSPLGTHGLSRATFTGGVGTAQGPFVDLAYRIAMHDDEDAVVGYPKDLVLTMGDIRLRLLLPDMGARLEQLTLVRGSRRPDILSQNPGLSWDFGIDATRLPNDETSTVLHAGLRGEVGVSLHFGGGVGRGALFVMAGGRVGSPVDAAFGFSPVATARSGLRWWGIESVRLNLEALLVLGGSLPQRQAFSLQASLMLSLSQSLSLRVFGVARTQDKEVGASVSVYF